ncbi:hypothetical protein BS78_03G054000 [Paspalum vaginatum]|nr:hypothetical protein BS78_03G054000 [Paspalum vaginatum]
MVSKASEKDLGPLAASSFPLLVYDHGAPPDDIVQTVLSVADGSLRTIQVPEMCNYTCLETPQGLVLMVDTAAASSQQRWLWNPQTGETTALPAMDEPLPDHCRCLLYDASSSPPPDYWSPDYEDTTPPDSLVLVYDLTRPEMLLYRIRGGAGWVRQYYDDMGLCEAPGRDPIEMPLGCMAVVQGTFYFLKSRHEVGAFVTFADGPEPCLHPVTFDCDEPKSTLVTGDGEKPPQTVATMSYLLESCGDLFLVCVFYLGCTMERIEEVGVYRMDPLAKEWCKVTDIGDMAFLLGPSHFAASCAAAEHGLKKGCVYYCNDLIGDSNEFHIFDLKEGTRDS